ncbi:MAG TPA: three-Cys-motif partner protein TcmP [Cyclobacteriaceae bacterium]|nr:three-Cys-motif partner protein TcmP [Cyclobacteriaceae bacterium]
MIKTDYWNIKPHTERKLLILQKYLHAWSDIMLSWYKKKGWESWKTPYYIDCFSGRGMYHKGDKLDSVKGSPLIAMDILLEKKKMYEEKYNIKINPRFRFIEYKAKWANELKKFVEPYNEKLDIKVYPSDFNDVIADIINETGFSPTFFFVDAGGIKELRKESIEKIVTKPGARDILLNYVVDGQKRIGGLAQSIFDGSYKGKQIEGAFKTIERLEDFTGMSIYQFLEETNNDIREALLSYVQNVLHANNNVKRVEDRLHTVVYDMKDLKRQKLIYYLLFSSRKTVATEIMKSIFKESKKNEVSQLSMFESDVWEIKH